ncbi:50S ribosomal protein L27 [Pseudomonas chlororaphis]
MWGVKQFGKRHHLGGEVLVDQRRSVNRPGPNTGIGKQQRRLTCKPP